jgi:hypothetical protein
MTDESDVIRLGEGAAQAYSTNKMHFTFKGTGSRDILNFLTALLFLGVTVFKF